MYLLGEMEPNGVREGTWRNIKVSGAWTPLLDCIDWDQGPCCSVTELSFVPIQWGCKEDRGDVMSSCWCLSSLGARELALSDGRVGGRKQWGICKVARGKLGEKGRWSRTSLWTLLCSSSHLLETGSQTSLFRMIFEWMRTFENFQSLAPPFLSNFKVANASSCLLWTMHYNNTTFLQSSKMVILPSVVCMDESG